MLVQRSKIDQCGFVSVQRKFSITPIILSDQFLSDEVPSPLTQSDTEKGTKICQRKQIGDHLNLVDEVSKMFKEVVIVCNVKNFTWATFPHALHEYCTVSI